MRSRQIQVETSDWRRLGATVFELLVVISILAVLAAVLLPAVQQAREAARRTQCRNNQRQLGLALHHFHDANGVFPASGWTRVGPANPDGSHISWRLLVAPYLELSAVTKQYRVEEDWWSAHNLGLGVKTPKVFRCPSTPTHGPIYAAAAKPPRPAMEFGQPLARCDYEALMGVRAIVNPVLYANRASTRAVLYRNSQVQFSRIRDGSSNTIAITECGGRPSIYRRRSRSQLLNDQGYGWLDSESGFSLDGSSRDGTRQGLGPGHTSIAINATNENEPYSFHIDGVNFLFADGRVSFLAQQTDLAIIAALATAAGGEIVDQERGSRRN